ncbi:hypothetical protein RyT2_19270 [Pseudolactococcus yaeyamensis]
MSDKPTINSATKIKFAEEQTEVPEKADVENETNTAQQAKEDSGRKVENSTNEKGFPQSNINIDLSAVEFSEGYKDNEKVPQSQDLTLVLEDSESLEWADDSHLFVRAELQDTETEEPVIYTPFVVDNPRETGFISWWEDNYEAIDKQIRSSDKVVALEKELDFRRLLKLEQEKILDEQTGVLSLFDNENNSNEVEQTVAEENKSRKVEFSTNKRDLSQSNIDINLRTVQFSSAYRNNEKVPRASLEKLRFVLTDDELVRADSSPMFVNTGFVDENDIVVIHAPFVVDKPDDVLNWWNDNRKEIENQVRFSEEVSTLIQELEVRKISQKNKEHSQEELKENKIGKVENSINETNEVSSNNQEDNSRLTQSRRKLERLKQEFATADASNPMAGAPFGQPIVMNSKGRQIRNQVEKYQDRMFRKLEELKEQEKLVEKLEAREEKKANGLNKQGNGLIMSVANMPRIQAAIAAYEKGEGIYTSDTIRKYKKELVNLEKMAVQSERNASIISPAAQTLIDSGAVSQWAKKPTFYFVKGLRKVALEIDDVSGDFKLTSNFKYQPQNDADRAKVEELLASQQQDVENMTQEEKEMAQETAQSGKVESSTFPNDPNQDEQETSYYVFKNDEDSFWISSNSWGIETTNMFEQALKYEDSLMADGYIGSLEFQGQGVETPDQHGYHKTHVDAKGQTIGQEQGVETILGNNHPITPEEADKAFEDERVREAVRKDVPAVEATKEEAKNDEEISLFKDLASITPKSEEATATKESTQVENSTLEKTEEENVTVENNQNFRDVVAHYLEETTGNSAFEDDEHKHLGKFTDERFTILHGNDSRDSYQGEVVTVLNQFFNQEISQAEVEKLIDGYVKASNSSQQERFDDDERLLNEKEEMTLQRDEELGIAAQEKEIASKVENPTSELQTKGKTTVENASPEDVNVTQDTIQNMVKIESGKISFEIAQTVDELLDEVEKATEDNSQYLTKDEIETLLDNHMKRIEGIITNFGNAYNKLENPTQEQTHSLLKQMFEAIRQSLKELRDSITSALNTKKDNLVDKVDDVRLTVKNGINRRILNVNDKLKNFADRIDTKFALEEKSKHEISEEDKSKNEDVEKVEEVVPEIEVAPQPKIKVKLGEPRQESVPEETTEVESEQSKDIETLLAEYAALSEEARSMMTLDQYIYEAYQQDFTNLDFKAWLQSKGETNLERFNIKDFQDHVVTDDITQGQEDINDLASLEATEATEAINDDLEIPDVVPDETVNSETEAVEQEVEKQTLSDIFGMTDTKERSAALADFMKDNLKMYLDVENWKKYLQTQTKFHSYSQRNVRMILAQNPDASMIASFNKWQKDFDRNVTKGSKSLKIQAPISYTAKDDKGNVLLDENNQPILKKGFSLTPVFDVAQTTGKEIPKEFYQSEDKLSQENFKVLYRAIVANSLVKVVPVDYDGVKSFYHEQDQMIGIAKGMGVSETLNSLIRETTHVSHQANSQSNLGTEAQLQQKFEAESIAYMVAHHFGVENQDYNFDYLSNWTESGKTLDNLEATLNQIQKEAHQLIGKINQSVAMIQDKNVNQESILENKISKAKEVQKTEVKENLDAKKAHAVNKQGAHLQTR